MKRDKEKVVDEVWDDEQVASFLHKVPPDLPGDPDFHVLLFAYRSMRPGDFGRFLDCYVAAGRDVTVRNGEGMTAAHYLSRHANAGPYIDLLESAAARSCMEVRVGRRGTCRDFPTRQRSGNSPG